MNAITHFHHIETKRLRLRPLVEADLPRLVAQADDPDVARMTTGIPHPYDERHARDFLARVERLDPAREAVFAIERQGFGLIGTLGFHAATPFGPELGYWLGRDHWGQGLATEAVRGALAWARGSWRKRLAMAGHYADNPASGQVLVKAGFLYTGEVLTRYSTARGGVAPTRMMVWLA